tara:strand:- start:2722 stop:3402 length:681 start_codon:yes stop_codon:yes gene_type:complete
MSFFKTKKTAEAVKQSSGSAYVNGSGCYPVNIIAPFASVSKGGSTSVDLFIEHEGQKQVVYGNMRITNNDDSVNEIGSKVFNQLAVIADVEDISDPVEAELPIGKNGADVDVGVLEDLADVDIMLRIQMEYSTYLGNIQEKKIIKGFFRAGDNASAEEIVNETEAGVQYEKDSKYFDNITYKDGLDADAIAAWVAAGRPKGTAGSSSASAAPKPSFGKKKSFGKKD